MKIQCFKTGPVRFTCGRKFYAVAHAYDRHGFIGLCDGRVIATTADPEAVVRAMVNSGA